MAPEPAVRPERYASSTRGGGSGVGARKSAYASAWLVPSGSSARWKSATRRFSRCSKRRRVLRREPDVDERRRVLLVARGDELVGGLAQHHRREDAAAELVGHRLVALEHEEARDAAVVLLGEGAHLAACGRRG